ncbi:MAG: alpha/beta hydrolase [Microbacteriaceae bacterium]|nr:alpha/beta hydrolase [Microbacteriaceae bacterium]
MPKPTIVLVHGSWADASSWNAVATELRGPGFTVLAPPNLLRGLPADAAYVASFVAQRTTGPVVLVGHSYGGAVITNAATEGGEVRALVYVDAFIPDEGETVFQILGGSGSALDVPDPTTVLDIVGYPGAPEGDAEAFLKPSTVHDAFAQDLPEADRWLIDRGGSTPRHAERQHHAIRGRGLEDAAELGGRRNGGPSDPAGHAASDGRTGGCHHQRGGRIPRVYGVAAAGRDRRHPLRRSRASRNSRRGRRALRVTISGPIARVATRTARVNPQRKML